MIQVLEMLPDGNMFISMHSRVDSYVHFSIFNITDNTSYLQHTFSASSMTSQNFGSVMSITDAGLVHVTGRYGIDSTTGVLLYIVIDPSDMTLYRTILSGDVTCESAYSSVAAGDYVISSIESSSKDFVIIYDTTDDTMESYAVTQQSRLKIFFYSGSGNNIDVLGITGADDLVFSELDVDYLGYHADLDTSTSITFTDVSNNYTYGSNTDSFVFNNTYTTTTFSLTADSADQGITQDSTKSLYSGVFYGDSTVVTSVTHNNTGVELTYGILSCSNFDMVTLTYQLEDTGTYAAPSWVISDSANGKLLIDTPVEITDTLYEFDVLTYFDDDPTPYEQRVNLTVEVCDDSNCGRCEPLDSSVCLD